VPNRVRSPCPTIPPVIGRIYRIAWDGLRLVPTGAARLEIGVGSGILVPSLTAGFPDMSARICCWLAAESLVTPGCRATFQVADLLDPNAVPAGSFDVVVCLSCWSISPIPRRPPAVWRAPWPLAARWWRATPW